MRGRSSAATAALALALVLCQPSAALGDQQVIENATSGTTLVTVQVEGNNIDPDDGELGKKTGNDHDPTVMSFVVPTLIPFKVLPDGTVRPVYLYCVDSDEFVVNKLLDRGSLCATTFVTNVQDFITIVAKGLGLL